MSLEERRMQLRREYSKGISNRECINEILNFKNASVEDDLRTTLALASTDALCTLLNRLVQQQVIRQAYRGVDGTGCLLYFLLGFESNDDLLDHPYESEEVLDCVCRSVRFWDFGILTYRLACAIVRECLVERERSNTAHNVSNAIDSRQLMTYEPREGAVILGA